MKGRWDNAVKDQASSRQLAVAAFTGLLSLASATAGMDWWGALCAVPVILIVARCWECLGANWMHGLGKGVGVPLRLLYLAWTVALAGVVLAAAAARITAPTGDGAGWCIALLWIPVLLLARKNTAVFGRAAEIFYLAMLVATVFVLLLGARQIRVERLLKSADSFWDSFVAATGIGCSGVAAVVLWGGGREGERPRWLAWSGALAVVTCLMRIVTVGVLGPTLAGEQERVFFLMAVGLSRTARMEGLIGAVWLLSDITLAGLLIQSGKGMRREKTGGMGTWVIILAGLGISLWINEMDWAEFLLKEVMPVAGFALGGVVTAALCIGGKGDAHFTAKK